MILIIAFGNSLRGDDGAGLVLGECLERAYQEAGMPVYRLSLQELTPETAVLIAGEDVESVIFTDAELADPRRPSLHLRPILATGQGVQELTAPATPAFGHQLTPETLLTMAAQLYGRRPPAWLITLPAVAFEFGESFSETTRQALTCAGTLLAPMLGTSSLRANAGSSP